MGKVFCFGKLGQNLKKLLVAFGCLLLFKRWLVHGESPLSLLYRETEGQIKKEEIHDLIHNLINFLFSKEEQGGQQAKACRSDELNKTDSL